MLTATVQDKTIASLEIRETSDGVFLLRIDFSGACIADTWHESVEQAKAQAEFEFNVNEWI